jgi:MFS family permease
MGCDRIGRDDVGRTTFALSFSYGSAGVFWGMLGVVFAEVIHASGLSPGVASSGLACFSVAALASMALVRPRLRSVRRATVLRYAWIAFAIGCGLLVLVPHPALIVGFGVTGIAAGVGDIGIHVVANELEERAGRSVLQWLHGGYSLGAVVGALAGGIGLDRGVSFRTLLLSAGVLPLASIPLLGIVDRVVPADTSEDAEPAVSRRARSMPPPGIGIPVVIVVAALLLEASLEIWSVVYMRGTLGASILVGAVSLAAFSLALALGRGFAAKVLFRLGQRTTLLVSGVGSLACTMVIASVSSAYVAGVALLLLGFFLSPAAPAAYGLVTGTPHQQEDAVAWIGAASYVGYAIGPPALGAFAGAVGFRSTMIALAFVSVPIAAAGLASRRSVPATAEAIEAIRGRE